MAISIPNVADAGDAIQARLFSEHLAILGQAYGPYGPQRGIGSECALSYVSGLTYRVAAGQVNGTVSGAANWPLTVSQTDLTPTDTTAPDKRFDLIVVPDGSATPILRTGAADPNPDPPSPTAGDIVLGIIFLDGSGSGGAGKVHDFRVIKPLNVELMTTTQRNTLTNTTAGLGRAIYDYTLGGMAINTNLLGGSPVWTTFGQTIIGSSTAGENLELQSNESRDGSVHIMGGGTAANSINVFQCNNNQSTGSDVAARLNTRTFWHSTIFQSSHVTMQPSIDGYRAGFGANATERSNQHTTWYPTGYSNHHPSSRDGLDSMLSISTHGRMDSAHDPRGFAHQTFYVGADSWTDTTHTVNSTISDVAEGTRETITLNATTNIKYGEVLLIAPSTFVPRRDHPSAIDGHEYVYVIPPVTGPWGSAGSITGTTVDVLRGFWGTRTYGHSVGEKVYYVTRQPSARYFNVEYGPDSYGFYGHRGSTDVLFDNITVATGADWIHGGVVAFHNDIAGNELEETHLEAAGFEAATDVNVVQTLEYYATGGPGGVAQPATAFRITGHNVASDHATTLNGAMFFRQDINEFRFRTGGSWYDVALVGKTLRADWAMGNTRTVSVQTVKVNKLDSYEWPSGGNNPGIELFDTPQTFTESKKFFEWNSTHTMNAASLSPVFLLTSGQMTFNYNALFVSGFTLAHTIQRSSANSGTDYSGIFWGFRDAITYTIDTLTAKTVVSVNSFHAATTTSRTNSGTFTITDLNQFAADVTIGAGTTVTNRYGFKVNDASVSGTLTNNYGIYVTKPATHRAPSSGAGGNQGIHNEGTTMFTPSAAQSVTTATTAFNWDATSVQLNVSGTFTNQIYTATPTAGAYGQVAILRNVGANRISIPTHSIGSNSMYLKDGHRTLDANDLLLLWYGQNVNSGALGWHELAYASNLGTVRKTDAVVPSPAMPTTAAPAGVALSSSDTFVGRVRLNSPMIITAVYINVTSGSSSNTCYLAIYNERGTRVVGNLSVLTIGAGVKTLAVSPSVSLQAGDYYVGVSGGASGGAHSVALYDTDDTFNDPASGAVLSGTVTSSSNQPPTSITPASITAVADRIPYVRFDGTLTG